MKVKKLLGPFMMMLWLLLAQLSSAVTAPIEIKVHFDSFPPYSILEGTKRSGIAVEMINIMNEFQSRYHFSFITNPPMRRFQHFDQGKYDMSTFDHLHWGWDKDAVDASDVYLRGGEKYVALAKGNRGQEYFDVFQGKKIGAYLGYHYAMANFNNDPKTLLETYNMELSTSHKGNLLKLLKGRVDMVILTDAFLSRWFILHPEDKNKLLVSDKWDQEYKFVLIIRKGISPTVKEINELLQKMKQAGVLTPIWKKYGISPDAY